MRVQAVSDVSDAANVTDDQRAASQIEITVATGHIPEGHGSDLLYR